MPVEKFSGMAGNGRAFRVAARLVGVAALAVSVAASAASAEPPRFEVRDADSTLTLMGTIHVLRPETTWRDQRLDKAFMGAEEVWFEIKPGSETDPQLAQAVQKSGIDLETPLSKRLSAVEYAKFEAAAASLGMQAAQLNVLRPWLAALQLTLGIVQKAGYRPDSGVEKVLAQETGNRPVKAFETAAEQLSFFAGFSPELEKALLLEAIDQVELGAGRLNQMVEKWRAGDLAGLDSLINQELRRDFPELYDALVVRRNTAWVARIKAEMAGAGTDFIAVGAGHLVGADGVPELLRKAGYTVVQVSGSPGSANPDGGKKSKKRAK